jgi:signal peptidase
LKKDKKENEYVETIVYIVLGIAAAYLLNYGLGLLLGTKLPVVAVVSESMTHDSSTLTRHYQFLQENLNYSKEQVDSWPIKNGFLKGDALVVMGVPEKDLKVGDVIVYDINGQNTPIVHRIVKLENGQITTKGDHNPSIDPWKPVKIHGKAIIVIPFLGWPKLLLTQLLGGIMR